MNTLALPKTKKSEYTVVVYCHCHECDCHDLSTTVEAKNAVKALHKAARKFLFKLPTEYKPIDISKLHDYTVSVECAYGNDHIESGCEAESAIEAIYQAAMFDENARKHRANEW